MKGYHYAHTSTMIYTAATDTNYMRTTVIVFTCFDKQYNLKWHTANKLT